jgi:hypothetical protein
MHEWLQVILKRKIQLLRLVHNTPNSGLTSCAMIMIEHKCSDSTRQVHVDKLTQLRLATILGSDIAIKKEELYDFIIHEIDRHDKNLHT